MSFFVTFVAAGKGLFAEEGLEVDLPQMTSNAAIPAITNKQVHLAIGGSGVRAAYQGAPLRGIFYTFKQVTFLAIASPEVRSYRDLPGKVIAVSSPGGSDDWISKRLLQREGIPLADVQIVPLGQAPQRAQGILAGQVHFSAMSPDLAADLERRGFNNLGDLGEVMPLPWGGFVAHVDTIREQPDALKAWIRAHIRALQLTKRSPAEAAEVAIRELGVDREIALKAVQYLGPAISEDDPGGLTEASLLFNTQFDLDAVPVPGDPLDLGRRAHDLTLLRQAQREMGIRCTTGYQCQ
jgi:NitT/TauT family transport system substrate-binding protein